MDVMHSVYERIMGIIFVIYSLVKKQLLKFFLSYVILAHQKIKQPLVKYHPMSIILMTDLWPCSV
jgi:hypothetical protein